METLIIDRTAAGQPEEPSHVPTELAAMLSRMQREAPAEVFAAVLAGVRPRLADGDWARLMSAIGPVPPVAR